MTVRCSVVRWPILTLELSGVADRAHSEALLQTLSTRIASGPCAVLLDTRRVQLADQMTKVENLQREARWLRHNELLIERDVVAFALVVDSGPVRFLFSSLLSMASLRTKWLATTHLDEAERFCERALLRAKVSIPARPQMRSASSIPPRHLA